MSGLGRPQKRGRLTTPVFWPGKFQGLHSIWGRKKLDKPKRLSLSTHRRPNQQSELVNTESFKTVKESAEISYCQVLPFCTKILVLLNLTRPPKIVGSCKIFFFGSTWLSLHGNARDQAQVEARKGAQIPRWAWARTDRGKLTPNTLRMRKKQKTNNKNGKSQWRACSTSFHISGRRIIPRNTMIKGNLR